MKRLTLFRCEKLSARLSIASCAARWERGNAGRPGGSKAAAHDARARVDTYAACRGCPVGERHAKTQARRERDQAYERARDRGKKAAAWQRWYHANKERRALYDREWRAKNPDKEREQQRRARARRTAAQRARKRADDLARYHAHRDAINERKRARRAAQSEAPQ
jgi:hypothetical protein